MFTYSSAQVGMIKTVAGHRWHQQEKHRTMPQTNETVPHLLTSFAGELSYIVAFAYHTLSWKRLRYPKTSGILGAHGHNNDHDRHALVESEQKRRKESSGYTDSKG
jgi:hypothetical protein